MKKLFSILTLLFLTLNLWAQEEDCPFRGKFVNSELEVAIVLNLYEKNVKVPQQEILGNIDGYLYYKHDGRKWIIVESEIQGDIALLTIVNDYGSEDLTATLTHQPDGSFVLKQESGSSLKIVKSRKWMKLPKKIIFKKD